MKTFSKLLEDIEMVSGIGKPSRVAMHGMDAEVRETKPRKVGVLGGGEYTIHQHGGNGSRDFFVVHNKTKKVAAHIAAEHKANKNMHVSVAVVHPEHTSKKIGHSLVMGVYKHLHDKGYNVHSDTTQSPGGASIWHRMMQDKELSPHIHIMTKGKRGSIPAKGVPTDKIWTTHSKHIRKTSKIGLHKSLGSADKDIRDPENLKVMRKHLVLKGKRK